VLLDSIDSPGDLKNLSMPDLQKLCEELRNEIIRITYKNGGHLGSNLGVVELTVALHYVFESPKDKLILDVGHQAYAHKILTGRKDLMENMRTEAGASGFLDPEESEHDAFIAGHASTAMSAALGIAKARDLQDRNFKVISIVGDGSMSGGMAFEALNNIGCTKDFIVILNDNQMSISKTVGSLSIYLSKLLSSKGALSIRRRIRKFLDRLPKKISLIIERIVKNSIFVIRGRTIFEDFGLQYVGPIDGNNLPELIETLKSISDFAGYKPVLLHVYTKKGNGHEPAEKDVYKLHGIDNTPRWPSYTDIFSKRIVQLAERNDRIVCITAAMESGCGLSQFSSLFPNRFFDVGIAEAHAVTFAAGLAAAGASPFVCIYSTFFQRAFDQIYHDVVLPNLPVRFIVNKAGLPGKDGKTHSGIYDMAIFSMFPNVEIFTPSDTGDLISAIDMAAQCHTHPVVVRFPKVGLGHGAYKDVLTEGNLLILAIGSMAERAHEALYDSEAEASIISIRKIQPFDFERLHSIMKVYDNILLLEEGITGGFSSALLHFLSAVHDEQTFKKLHILTLPKEPTIHDSIEQQLEHCKMSVSDISVTIRKIVASSK
jgi:1-deoxy-D-xylulose-5-phosphate synthase